MSQSQQPPDAPALLTPTPRTSHRRRAARGSHERALIEAILDEALVCQIAVSLPDGPHVLPTAHVRIGDFLYFHGARQNQLLVAALAGPACVSVTLLDGLVFSREAFHHSMNYRSVVLFGQASEVSEAAEKERALRALIERAAPGRWQEVIAPSAAELAATLVLRFPIQEGSAKVRSGPPLDPVHEAGRGIWAGVLPLRLVAGAPRVDALDEVPPQLSAAVAARGAGLSFDAESPAQASEAALRVPYERALEVPELSAALATDAPLLLSTDRARIDVPRVHGFLCNESYWAAGLSEATFRRACAASLCFGVYQGREQLAFARVVSDFVRFAYLADVFVHAPVRGRGLGKALVCEILQHPQLAQIETWLLGTRDAHGLYARFGFQRMPEGRYMARRS